MGVEDSPGRNPSRGEFENLVLNRIQCAFPVCSEPYAQLADAVGGSAADVHQVVQDLRDEGIVRRLGGTFVPAQLGYVSVLACARVAPEELESVAAVVSACPGVTHNYERNDVNNLWFTLSAQGDAVLQAQLDRFRACAGVHDLHPLPALHTFKIKVNFRFGEDSAAREESVAAPQQVTASSPVLDDIDRRLVRAVCGDMGGSLKPFAELATALSMDEATVLARLSGYLDCGRMRRFGVMLRHQSAGFVANGMSAWDVPAEAVQEVGRKMASFRSISHCYERPRFEGWPYNMYGMIHGGSESDCMAVAAEVAEIVDVQSYRVLFSTREFKKTSMVYFGEEL
jgi:DNA-binding Lrp family transcriptional regulator